MENMKNVERIMYCDLRFPDKQVMESDTQTKQLIDDGWEIYKEYFNEDLNLFNRFFIKKV